MLPSDHNDLPPDLPGDADSHLDMSSEVAFEDPMAGESTAPPPQEPAADSGTSAGPVSIPRRESSLRPVTGPLTPPHDLHAERAVLGALMLSDQARFHVAVEGGLRETDFYAPQNQAIYGAIRQLFGENQPIDSITVVEQLRRTGQLETAGGRDAVWELSASVTEVAALPRHVEIVGDTAELRRLLEATYEIQSSVIKGDQAPADIVEQAQKMVFEVSQEDVQNSLRTAGSVVDGEIERLQELERDGRDITGVATGFRELDQLTSGLQPGAFIVLAARPAMGKSALVTNLAENVAMRRENAGAVALFSLEMPERELLQRLIASQAGVKGEELRKGRVGDKWPDVMDTADRLRNAPLYIDDSSDIGIMEIRAKARRLNSQYKHGVDLVIVDYLQLMRADTRTESRVQAVGEMSRGLKILAQEIGAPVIALSQLSRGVESRPDKRPMLQDLRESGNIEQDADMVMFLYRDDYYNAETAEPGVAELIIAKNRSGRTDTVRLLFQKEYPRFMSLAMPGDAVGGPPGRFSAPALGAAPSAPGLISPPPGVAPGAGPAAGISPPPGVAPASALAPAANFAPSSSFGQPVDDFAPVVDDYDPDQDSEFDLGPDIPGGI